MESQFSTGFGVAQGSTGGQPHAAGAPDAPPPPLMSTRMPELILRIVAAVLTFISAIVMGTARQTTVVVATDPFSGQLSTVTNYTKSTYSAALVHFVVANVLAFFYSAVSLALTVVNKDGLSSMSLPLLIGDLLMVVLLFSSNGAAAAISIVAENGQLNFAGWMKICNFVGGFCARMNAAIVLSMLASVAYVVIVVFRMAALRKSSF